MSKDKSDGHWGRWKKDYREFLRQQNILRLFLVLFKVIEWGMSG
jgi:hypothetical protein